MPIHSFGACNLPFDVSVSSPNVISAVAESTLASPSESAQVSVPVIWNQANDSYYEPDPNGGNFYRYVGSASQLSNYRSQPDLTVASYVRVANLLNDRSVNYYIFLDPSTVSLSPTFRSNALGPNTTKGSIAGRWETITCTFTSNSSSSVSSSYSSSSTEDANTSQISYTQTSYTSGVHNLITGNEIRCIDAGNTNLTVNSIYYVINTSNTNNGAFQIANSYSNSIGGVAMTVTGTSSVTFRRQAGWLRVHEGTATLGNGGDPVYVTGGTGNYWVRNPYNVSTKTRVLLSSYSSTTVYSKGDRVLHDNKVWDCLSHQNSSNALTPGDGLVLADFTGRHGSTMTEIPEFYVRRDFFNGTSWRNTKGADVSKDYEVLGGNNNLAVPINPFTSGRDLDFHFLWVIHKSQFNKLSTLEKSKYLKHPMFMEASDSESDRTFRMTAKEAGQLFPSGISPVGGASGDTISFSRNHGLSAGKVLYYFQPTAKGPGAGISGLINSGFLYVQSVPSSTSIKVSLTKGGSAITELSVYYYLYGPYYGSFTPIVTKTSQTVVSISLSTFTTPSDHQLMVGQKVQLFFSGTISGFTSGSYYYVCNPNYFNNTLQLSSSLLNAISNTVITASSVNFSNCYISPVVVDNIDNPNFEITSSEVSSVPGRIDTLVLDWVPGFSSHWLVTGDTVIYNGQLSGLTSGSKYFVIYVSDTKIKLATSYLNALNGVSVEVTGSNFANSSLVRADYSEVTFPGSDWPIVTINNDTTSNSYEVRYKGTFNPATYEYRRVNVSSVTGSIFSSNNHGLKSGNVVYLYFDFNTTLTNFSLNAMYWVVNATTSTFGLSSTKGGAAITVGATNTATNINVALLEVVSRKTGHNIDYRSCGVWYAGSGSRLYRKSGGVFENERYGDLFNGYTTGALVYYNTPHGDNYGATYNIVSINTTNSTLNSGAKTFIVNDQLIRFGNVGNITNINSTSYYYIKNKNETTGDYQISATKGGTAIVIGGTVGSSWIYPKILDEIQPGPYYIRVYSDNGLTLHNSYSDAVNNVNPISVSEQPKWTANPAPVWVLNGDGGFPRRDLYGAFHEPHLQITRSWGVSSITNPENNKQLGWNIGDTLVLYGIGFVLATEGRSFRYLADYGAEQSIFRSGSGGNPRYTLGQTTGTAILSNYLISQRTNGFLYVIPKGENYYSKVQFNQAGTLINIGCDEFDITSIPDLFIYGYRSNMQTGVVKGMSSTKPPTTSLYINVPNHPATQVVYSESPARAHTNFQLRAEQHQSFFTLMC
jgi:hypothetical protein